MSTSCTSNSGDLLIEETNVASGTNERDINNMIALRKCKIKALRRAFLAKENEGDEAKIVATC